MDQSQLDKLPKWAREHFITIQRERDNAVRALNEYVDNQTPSEIYIDEYESTGEKSGPTTKRRYIQGHNVEFNHAGIGLRVNIYREGYIELQWGRENVTGGEIALIPHSYQFAHLVAKENMR